ncbi:putative purine-cytosine permease YxlA [Alicyclobacillus contaminans]|uniref:purine-cytosine permease family protein n=1 Tax=Alicyclobacillus contaminans TaxID=392016 RepID=UPI00040035B0|nr:cytosine permease [Alicyclobacillus contaminans]GMA50712.1 putative purine-cytosine permease YxlA [Alicyclobacillus contaminans]
MLVEKRSIDFIPEEERHGKPRSLFNIWFSGNMQLTPVMTGAALLALGLNVFWAVLAVIIGNMIGGLFMATHSAQGPKLGIPQMIQSRAQFGVIGAILPLILVMVMYVGSVYYSGLLGAQAIHSALHGVPIWLAMVVLNAVTLLVTTYGYDVIHTVEKYFAIIFALFFLFITIEVFRLPFPAHSWSVSGFKFGPFMMAMSICVSWLLTYAPYVADYSRYLPKNTSTKATFGWTYAGGVLGTAWPMLIGVLLIASTSRFGDDPTGVLAQMVGPVMAPILYLVIVLGILGVNVLNLYCAFMATVTTIEPFTKLKVTPTARFVILGIIDAVATWIGIQGQGSLITIIGDFMLMLQYMMVPWSAINLVDFYLLRKGNYSIKDIFDLNGKYGRFNWISIGAYLLTIVAQIPFMNVAGIYEGPISKAWGHADFAWIIALLLPSTIYYFAMKPRLASTGELEKGSVIPKTAAQ